MFLLSTQTIITLNVLLFTNIIIENLLQIANGHMIYTGYAQPSSEVRGDSVRQCPSEICTEDLITNRIAHADVLFEASNC